MKKTTWLLVSLLLLAFAVESHSQSEFISSTQTASCFSLGYATRSNLDMGRVVGGLTMNGWSDGLVYFAVSDLGPTGSTLYSMGMVIRPFVRAPESDGVSIILGLPATLEAFNTTGGGGGTSYFGCFGSIGGSLDIPIRTGTASCLDLSVAWSFGDFFWGDDLTDGGTSATSVGIAQSVPIGSGSLLILGVGASFVEDADEATLLFQLGFLFPKPR
jgi:hypothetical protein